MRCLVVVASAALSACLMLPDESSTRDRLELGSGSGPLDAPIEGSGGSDALTIGPCNPGTAFGESLFATPMPQTELTISVAPNGSGSANVEVYSTLGSGSGSGGGGASYYTVLPTGTVFSVPSCFAGCVAGSQAAPTPLAVSCMAGSVSTTYHATLVLCVSNGGAMGSASVDLACKVGSGGVPPDAPAGAQPDASGSGSGSNPESYLDRQTYYACSTGGSGSGAWPILAAIGACFLARRRRRV